MTPSLWLTNLWAYSLQVVILVGATALVVAAFRVPAPRVRLAIWQALLIACLALPFLQPWRPVPAPRPDDVTTEAVATSMPPVAAGPAAGADSWGIPLVPLLAGLLVTGAVLRLSWLSLGLLRLARYRRDMTVLDPPPQSFTDASALVGVQATIGVAAGLSGPATFGLRHPLVLLPPAVLTLDPALQQSVVCHELLHVRRRDWIWSVAEEILCAVAWFHPAIWWLLAQIDLAREQLVDAEVVRLTGARKPYLEALLYLANPDRGADLAPAPALLRRRHLARRLLVLAQEVSMSRSRIVSLVAMVAALAALTAAAAAASFPLVGPPADDPVVAERPAQEPVRIGGNIPPPRKIVDVRPVYPPDAREAGVQGVVILEILVAQEGTVADARVLRSIPLLDQSAIEAVRQWVFTPTLINGTAVPVIMTITVNFTLDDEGAREGVPGGVVGGVPGGVVGGVPGLPQPRKIVDVKPVYPEEAKRQGVAGTVVLQATIEASGSVSDVKVLRSIPMLDQAAIDAVRQWQFEPPPKRVVMTTTVRFSLGELTFPQALYPPEAVAAKVEGIVILDAVIGVSGKVVSVKLVEGPSLLAQSAISALERWNFQKVTAPMTARIEIEYRIKDGKPSVSWRGSVNQIGLPAVTPGAQTPPREGSSLPNRVYYVAPVYPEEARAQKVQGIVTLEVLIGTNGVAADVKVIEGDELLDGAAIDAVRMWRWEPPAMPVVATLTVRFALDAKAEQATRPNLTDTKKLEIVSQVRPMYPREAREAKLSGRIQLEIVVDEHGIVSSARVLEGPDVFHQASLDAVRQWIFKAPGKPVKTTVDMTFTLK